jgi:serine protease Do
MAHRPRLSAFILLMIGGLACPAVAQVAPPATHSSTTRPSPSTAAATRPAATRPVAVKPLPNVGRPTTIPVGLLKPLPDSIEDLRALQKQVRDVVAKVSPTVVGLQIGGGQGSGVIITDDGFVLTAAHVSGTPGRNVTVFLSDGRRVAGKTMGANNAMDAGLRQLTPQGPLPEGKGPTAALGTSSGLRPGQWCVAMGHPGGYRNGRTAPLRLGRVLEVRVNAVRTDCTLVGGDSGGPLFDMHGRVIGIHSRIGGTLSDNLHVPVDAFRNGWMRMAGGEQWGEAFWQGRRRGPGQTPPKPKPAPSYLGVEVARVDVAGKAKCRVDQVYAGSPARRAGMQAGDVIEKFDGSTIATPGNLQAMLELREPGTLVDVIVKRGEERVTLKVKLARRLGDDE